MKGRIKVHQIFQNEWFKRLKITFYVYHPSVLVHDNNNFSLTNWKPIIKLKIFQCKWFAITKNEN